MFKSFMQFPHSGYETGPPTIETSDSSSEESKSRKYFDFLPTISTHKNTVSTSISFYTIKNRKKIKQLN